MNVQRNYKTKFESNLTLCWICLLQTILKNNENGFIMEPGDKIAIYHAISKLMANEAMTKRMGENSLNKVQEHLPDYVARQLQTLYDSLV